MDPARAAKAAWLSSQKKAPSNAPKAAAAAAAEDAPAYGSELISMAEMCNEGTEFACTALLSEDAAKLAWLAKQDVASPGSKVAALLAPAKEEKTAEAEAEANAVTEAEAEAEARARAEAEARAVKRATAGAGAGAEAAEAEAAEKVAALREQGRRAVQEREERRVGCTEWLEYWVAAAEAAARLETTLAAAARRVEAEAEAEAAEEPPERGANGEALTGKGYRSAPRPGEPSADTAPIPVPSRALGLPNGTVLARGGGSVVREG
jgi:hypothetical protein